MPDDSPRLAPEASRGSVGATERAALRFVTVAQAAPGWDLLSDAVGAPPWLRPGWFDAWWTAFGSGTPAVAVLEDAAGLAAVAPLARGGAGLVSMTNYHTPAWGIVARDEVARGAMAAQLLRARMRRLSLQFVPATGADMVAIRAAAGGRRVVTRVLERCPVVDTSAGWDAFEAGLRGHFRRELRRRARGLETLGAVTFDVSSGPDDLDELLDQGFAVEAAAWKGERGSAIASRPSTEGFYRAVGRWAAERGWLRLAFLRVDDRAVAFDFALEAGGVHALLKTGYEPGLRRYAPGMLLRQRMLRRAFDLGLAQYQFLGRDDPWKRAWTEAAEEQLLVQVFAGTPTGLADWAAHRWARPLAVRLLRR
jgi:CelD/BcsL family acetyltransferase involved in cellulose biosynthesis